MDWSNTTSFLILNVLEKSSNIILWKDIMSEKMAVIHHQHREMLSPFWRLTQKFSRQGRNVGRIGDRIGRNFEPWGDDDKPKRVHVHK